MELESRRRWDQRRVQNPVLRTEGDGCRLRVKSLGHEISEAEYIDITLSLSTHEGWRRRAVDFHIVRRCPRVDSVAAHPRPISVALPTVPRGVPGIEVTENHGTPAHLTSEPLKCLAYFRWRCRWREVRAYDRHAARG